MAHKGPHPFLSPCVHVTAEYVHPGRTFPQNSREGAENPGLKDGGIRSPSLAMRKASRKSAQRAQSQRDAFSPRRRVLGQGQPGKSSLRRLDPVGDSLPGAENMVSQDIW